MGQIQSEENKCTGSIISNEENVVAKQTSKQQSSADSRRHCSFRSSDKPMDERVRKLSIVSNRNIQLLSMKPRSDRDVYVDNLRQRRRSSLINLILGAPSSGPRFCDDLCSLNSRLSEGNFGIEFFPDAYNQVVPSMASIEDVEKGVNAKSRQFEGNQRRRSLSTGSQLQAHDETVNKPSGCDDLAGEQMKGVERGRIAPSSRAQQARKQFRTKNASIAATMASIDLTSSFDKHDMKHGQPFRSSLAEVRHSTIESISEELRHSNLMSRAGNGRVNHGGRVLRRAGSELSLYSSSSASNNSAMLRHGSHASASSSQSGGSSKKVIDHTNETKFIIMMQVCLPFILAGFGNMSAGLILNKVAQWESFRRVPIFFALLPPFIGLKGNIEMTLASRLSTLSNLNLLESRFQKRRAYASNLALILSQALELSIFAALLSTICELTIGHGSIKAGDSSIWEISIYVVLASVLATSIVLVSISSIVMLLAISLARYMQVNPDNLTTLIAAMYGDVTCVLTYGLITNWMFSLRMAGEIAWPISIIVLSLVLWPLSLYLADKFEETHSITLSSIPPMLTSMIVSMGSGAILSQVVDRYHLIALYQPVVNGFGANLIAVQASRVSTWLWCGALRKLSTVGTTEIEKKAKSLGSMVSFVEPVIPIENQSKSNHRALVEIMIDLVKTFLWSFFNKSPNSVAAKLLLVMLIPAHTIYFFVIWLLAPAGNVTITWQFFTIYITLCLLQVFILLLICEPLMTLLMRRHLDPDIFGISLLMALADLTGTLCLAGAFHILSAIGDINAS